MKNTKWKSLDGHSSTEISPSDGGRFILRHTSNGESRINFISSAKARRIADALDYLEREGLITGGDA